MCKVAYLPYASCGCKMIELPPICCPDIIDAHPRQGLWTRTIVVERYEEKSKQRIEELCGRNILLGDKLHRIITRSSHHILPWHDCKEVDLTEVEGTWRNPRRSCPLHISLDTVTAKQARSVERKNFAGGVKGKGSSGEENKKEGTDRFDEYKMSGGLGD